MHTGMRRGELLGLRWQDVDLAKGVLRVCQSTTMVKSGDRFTLPKTASGRRTIALGAPCVAALREHKAYTSDDIKRPPFLAVFCGWARRDSNPQPRDYESLALTVELQARIPIVRAAAVCSNVGRYAACSRRLL